jgi:hypothetical protein
VASRLPLLQFDTRRGAICKALRTASPKVAYRRLLAGVFVGHPRTARYNLHELSSHAPWTATMIDNLCTMLETDLIIGTTALNLLSNSLAPNLSSMQTIRQRYVIVRRFRLQGGNSIPVCDYAFNRALHGMARTT